MSIKAIALDGRTIKSIYEGSTRLFPPYEELEYVQTDSTNSYKKGDKVLYQGKTYESLIDTNVWSPSAYPAGWKEV